MSHVSKEIAGLSPQGHVRRSQPHQSKHLKLWYIQWYDMINDLWYIYDIWCMIYDIWYTIYDIYMICDIWYI